MTDRGRKQIEIFDDARRVEPRHFLHNHDDVSVLQ